MNRAPLAAAFAAALILGPPALARAQVGPMAPADAASRAPTLSLTGEGEVWVSPDVAHITLGVMTTGLSAAGAAQANAQAMAKVMDALSRMGVAARDIRTTQLNISPQYVYRQNEAPQLAGFSATNDVALTLRDLSRVGAVLDAATAAGANQAGSVSFDVMDRRPVEDQARIAAVHALQEKAGLYAKAAGLRIVRLVSLREGGAPVIAQPVVMAQARQVTQAVPVTSVSGGQILIRAEVGGVYELGR